MGSGLGFYAGHWRHSHAHTGFDLEMDRVAGVDLDIIDFYQIHDMNRFGAEPVGTYPEMGVAE